MQIPEEKKWTLKSLKYKKAKMKGDQKMFDLKLI